MKRGMAVLGFIFTAILGTLLHFVYEWSGKMAVAGFISSVNESTWEHLKLLYLPMVLFGVFEFFSYGRDNPCFLPAKLWGIMSGMIFITAFFYTYRGILGFNVDFLNIFDFFLGAAVAWAMQYKLLHKRKTCSPIRHGVGLLGLIILGVLFAVFTFYPPDLGIFIDPTI